MQFMKEYYFLVVGQIPKFIIRGMLGILLLL